VTLYLAPTLNLNGPQDPVKYAISVDLDTPQEVQFVPDISGEFMPEGWETAVSDNIWKSVTAHAITEGSHTLKVWALHPSVIFQKIVVDFGGVRESYFGPPESFKIENDYFVRNDFEAVQNPLQIVL
jgi:hypothetical protein